MQMRQPSRVLELFSISTARCDRQSNVLPVVQSGSSFKHLTVLTSRRFEMHSYEVLLPIFPIDRRRPH